MAVRTWTCRACRTQHPRRRAICPCGKGRRPKASRPAHRAVLDVPYEEWVARFGERCGICGAGPSATRRLDRDHDHKTGEMRGLLCHRCNRGLPNWADAGWLAAAAEYLAKGTRGV